MINRHILKVIENTRQHFPCVLLTGPRQVGKSTLLSHAYAGKGYGYVSLDDNLEKNLAKSDPRTFLSIHPYPLIIDEAQKAPELFSELERIINQRRLEVGNKEASGMYILTGSTRAQLLEAAEESLAGRVGIISMWPLSLSEIMSRNNQLFGLDIGTIGSRAVNSEISTDTIFEYVVRGALPQLYDDPETPTDVFFSSYISTYLEKDLREILNVSDEIKFMNFLRLLASNIGQELVYENYANQVGVKANTIKAWISALEKTGIIYLLYPYNEESIAKRIIKRPKMYFFDTGLAAYLVGITDSRTLTRSFMKGRFFENFAMNEVRKTFDNEGIHQLFYYYRDSNQNEIDLVYIKDGEMHLADMKAGTEFNASDTSSFKQLASTRFVKGNNYIICTADRLSMINDGTFIIPITGI